MAAADHHRAVGELLEGEFAAAQDHHRLDEGRHAAAHHQHGRDHFQRHRLAKLRRDAIGPGAGRVHDLGRLDRPVAGLDPPHRAVAREPGHPHAFDHLGAPLDGAPAEGLGGAEGIGSTVTARDHAAGAMVGYRRHQALQLGAVDQLFVGKTPEPQIVDAGAEARQLLLALRHQHRAVAGKAAIVADQTLRCAPKSPSKRSTAGSRRCGAPAGARRRH